MKCTKDTSCSSTPSLIDELKQSFERAKENRLNAEADRKKKELEKLIASIVTACRESAEQERSECNFNLRYALQDPADLKLLTDALVDLGLRVTTSTCARGEETNLKLWGWANGSDSQRKGDSGPIVTSEKRYGIPKSKLTLLVAAPLSGPGERK